MDTTLQRQKTSISFEEYMKCTDEDSDTEWVRGEIVPMSPVSGLHQDVSKFLMFVLDEYVLDHNLGTVRYERFTMRLGSVPSAREPDILFVSNSNLSRLTETFVDGPADLVVEVVSLESRERDRKDKFREYEQGGVQEYWLIDPTRQEADFYLLGEDGLYSPQPIDDDGFYRSRELAGFRIRPEWLWQDPLPRLRDILAHARRPAEKQ